MNHSHITSDGDMLDEICLKYYQNTHSKTLQAVLNANPRLCRQPKKLPAGVTIVLPIIETEDKKETVQTINLWD